MSGIINHIIYGKGQPIIFLHGWGGNISSFYDTAVRLKDKYMSILVDLYGFGETPHPDKPLILMDYTQSIKELIKYYSLCDVVLIGHSFGGRIAMQYASLYKSVDKLVLIDSAGMKKRKYPLYYFKIWTYKLKKRLKLDTSKYGSDDYRKLSSKMKQTFINIVNYNQDNKISNIYSKTLIIWGRKDKDTPLYMAKRINKKIIGSKLIVYENAGHYSYLDNKSSFFNNLTSFLNTN